ncbi:MAG: peptidoglycan bridge formation glycyltransferase FemA/FemB family protein [Anaerolineales bacterium]|nr:peptidoglycan bridge formation glycyltransferase FemA/FemB family protein [Anaerolineales bacterium]
MKFFKNYLHWDQYLSKFPNVHLLQTSAWGKFKQCFGWDVCHLVNHDWGAQILVKQFLKIFRFAYIPKGPVGSEESLKQWINQTDIDGFSLSLIDQIRLFCQEKGIAFVKIEPDILLEGKVREDCPLGFVTSQHSIQPLRTILIDISCGENEILARMKQKTRYNIRLAERKGVKVKPSEDVELFYKMMLWTGKRDRFGIHSLKYYEQVYRIFKERGECELFIALFEGKPIAGLMVFVHGHRAYYFYGASLDEHREVMAPYLLQWQAILWAKEQGCTVYDLWGVPDYDEDFLEQQFERRKDGLWGVYRFKRGFGGTLVRYAGAYDYIASPLIYSLYRLYRRQTGAQS